MGEQPIDIQKEVREFEEKMEKRRLELIAQKEARTVEEQQKIDKEQAEAEEAKVNYQTKREIEINRLNELKAKKKEEALEAKVAEKKADESFEIDLARKEGRVVEIGRKPRTIREQIAQVNEERRQARLQRLQKRKEILEAETNIEKQKTEQRRLQTERKKLKAIRQQKRRELLQKNLALMGIRKGFKASGSIAKTAKKDVILVGNGDGGKYQAIDAGGVSDGGEEQDLVDDLFGKRKEEKNLGLF